MRLGGYLVGPYARCVTDSKLKFWFIWIHPDGQKTRHEVTVGTYDGEFGCRSRPETGPKTRHFSTFAKYATPSDLSAFPSAPFPAYPRQKFLEAAISMLGDHAADIARVKMTGKLPIERRTA